MASTAYPECAEELKEAWDCEFTYLGLKGWEAQRQQARAMQTSAEQLRDSHSYFKQGLTYIDTREKAASARSGH